MAVNIFFTNTLYYIYQLRLLFKIKNSIKSKSAEYNLIVNMLHNNTTILSTQ